MNLNRVIYYVCTVDVLDAFIDVEKFVENFILDCFGVGIEGLNFAFGRIEWSLYLEKRCRIIPHQKN